MYTSVKAVQIPRLTVSNIFIQYQWLILCQNAYRINSGIDTVGVLTQYQPLRLNSHIGIGIPWDLDRNNGGVTVLPPYEKSDNSEWYSGTANAIYQNLNYIDSYNPEYVLILSGDHIYKMNYEVMLDFHKENKADVTIAAMPVPWEEASRFGLVITDENKQIMEFEEKPANPRSNLASMGIYIFNWSVLKDALVTLSEQSNCDFGKHIIPYCRENGKRLFAYEYNGYWKDVGTLGSYWEANMELIDLIPEFNLYEEYWKIYTKSEIIEPQYIAEDAVIERCIIGEGTEIYGKVYGSVIGAGVVIGKDTVVRDSIIMQDTVIGDNVKIGANTIILDTDCHAHSFMDRRNDITDWAEPQEIKIGNDVLIGMNTTILKGVTIGDRAIVGASSVVTKDIPADSVAAGNPARIIKTIDK